MTEENKNLNVVDTNNNLDEPSNEYATTAELMLMFGKSIDESLDIHNDLEKIVKPIINEKRDIKTTN
jgi:hypothetical protein